MKPLRIMLGSLAVLVLGLYATAYADLVTELLPYTSFTNGTCAGCSDNISEAIVTLNGSTLTVNSDIFIAKTPGADGLVYSPFTSVADSVLIVGGQSGAGTTGGPCGMGTATPCSATNPATVSTVLVNSPFTVGTLGTTPSNSTTNLGAYALAAGPNPFPGGSGNVVFALCNPTNSPCGNNFSYFTSGGGTGTLVTVSSTTGGNTTGVTGLAFNPSNNTWYYGATPDGSTAGQFGKVTFGAGNTAVLTPFTGTFAAHDLVFDPYTGDFFLVGGNEVEQVDANGNLIAARIITGGWQFDNASVDGMGHLFIASNLVVGGNDLVGFDYDCPTPAICTINGITPGFAFLMTDLNAAGQTTLDDIAPLAVMMPPITTIAEPTSLALLSSGLLGLALRRLRSRRSSSGSRA